MNHILLFVPRLKFYGDFLCFKLRRKQTDVTPERPQEVHTLGLRKSHANTYPSENPRAKWQWFSDPLVYRYEGGQ